MGNVPVIIFSKGLLRSEGLVIIVIEEIKTYHHA